ncbi:hypothetical protein [Photobacterium sp. J15]|uniref:hypothetical protein n=1 Tax=Photobacterium sp. J15 TaxID=265901 RepID=UPI0007E47781|nr:hypothetical protein [Photobacterium sp. J15]
MVNNKIYFEEITPEMIVAYFPDGGYTAKSMAQLNQICSMEYSNNFELVEITDENRDELKELGVFDVETF